MAVEEEERMRATRQDTFRTKKEHNLHRKYDLTLPFFIGLCAFLTSVEGGGKSERDARQKTSDVSRYLYYCNAEEVDPTFLCNQGKINEYISELKRLTTTSASSMKNILCSLINASSYLNHIGTIRSKTHKAMKTYMDSLKSKLNNSHRRRKSYNRLHRLEQDAATPDIRDATIKMRRYAPNVRRFMNNAKGLNAEERNTVTSYLVSMIAIENASRPGHVTNLTLQEFNTSLKIGNDHVAMCSYSKNGLAPVTFSKSLYDLSKQYVRTVRLSITALENRGSARLFINNKGKTLSNISGSKHLGKVLKMSGVNRKFTLTQFRKAVTTKAVRQYANEPRQLALFHGYLAHSPEVANMYYSTINSRREYHEGYQILQRIFIG